MNTINKRINVGDHILAMLTIRGKVIAQLSRNNFSSVSEIMISLREIAQNNSGLTQLFIRNFTEGWCINSPLFIAKSTKPVTPEIPPHIGKQYIFAWS